MNPRIKTYLFFALIFMSIKSSAQNLTGDWNGFLGQNNKTWSFVLNMKLMQSGNQITGFARITANTGAYVRHELRGEIDGNRIKITETRVVEDGSRGTWDWCIKIYNGILTRSGREYAIEGEWSNDGSRGFTGGAHHNSAFNCPPGRFRLSRVFTCAEEKAGLVVIDIERWREKGRYESTAEWQQRTSSLNTEIQYRNVVNSVTRNLINETELALDYDADAEIFTFHASCFADFQVKVPRSEAECFRKNFKKSNIRNLVFGFQPDTRNIVVDSIFIQNPCNQQAYVFPHPVVQNPQVDSGLTGVEPPPLQQREISIVNEIEVRSKTIEVRFYDNGTVDGDIISIYFNNELIQQRQALTSSPIRFTLQLKEGQDNIIAMYAENLGTIPPNTALMVVDDGINIIRIPLESNMQQSGAVRIRVSGGK
ncbi:MAG: hypothetical protein NVV59_15455 [Chitinophagaceae bacterium]|nr:hypothetical protein [Chitinophagaceae bacterium]